MCAVDILNVLQQLLFKKLYTTCFNEITNSSNSFGITLFGGSEAAILNTKTSLGNRSVLNEYVHCARDIKLYIAI
jgi:hypothetical protein